MRIFMSGGDKMRGIIKRILSGFVTVMMTVCLTLPAFAAQSADFTYEVISGSTDIRITGYTGSAQNVVIPDVLDGRTVVEISTRALSGNSVIKSVSIASSVRTIRQEAFKGCSSLQTVSIPASVSSVGDSAFANCVSLINVSISSASTSIGYYAFEGCTSLKSIVIPSAKIRDEAFKNCTMLESITLLDTVKSVGHRAFDGTAWYNLQRDDLLVIGNVVYAYVGNEDTVVLPAGIRCIADYAFSGTPVRSVIIPNGVYYIGVCAFYDCPNMKSVSIPDSVINMEMHAVGYNASGAISGFTVYADSSSTAYAWAVNNALIAVDIANCTHDYGDWITLSEATCTQSGRQMKRCIRCNHTETQEIDALGHSWSGEVTISELSCTVDGVSRKTCIICGETEDTVVAATGHTWGDWSTISEPNCTDNGEREHTCMVCSYTEKDITEPLGHTWAVTENTDAEGWIVDTDPTCDENGHKTRVCAICGTVDSADILPFGHTAYEWTVLKDPTAITTGLREGVCTVCGKTFTSEIPALQEDLPNDIKTLALTANSKLAFNASRTCVTGVTVGMTVTDVLLNFEYPSHIIVANAKLEQLDSTAVVGTGCFLFLVKIDNDTQQLTAVDTTCIVVQGDVDGNGVITAADARLALRVSAKLESLSTPAFLAADVDGNGNVTAADARKILRVASKLDTF